jgi:hypothetical protein
MASKTMVELIDDITGEPADESVTFGLDNITYTIDLSADNAKELRDRLAAFIESAQRVKAVKGGTKRAAGMTRDQNRAIRDWARGQGETVSERGRIPAELIVRFQEAHASA